MKYLYIFCFVILGTYIFAQILAPNGNFYDNNCEFSGAGQTDHIEAFFNDPDNDCVSNDWFAIFRDVNGDISFSNSIDWNPDDNGAATSLDFGYWNCCPLALGEPPCMCPWTFNEETNTVTIDCSSCPDHN